MALRDLAARLPALTGLLLTAGLLALFVSPKSVQAQWEACWDCSSVYWPGDDCWIDSCHWTEGAGSSNCSQFGQCDDPETCEPNGPGCEGYAVLLDGRSDFEMDMRRVYAWADVGSELPDALLRSREASAEYLRLSCNGAVVHATYSRGEMARIRLRTQRLVL